jgi:hypothetical protein
MAISRLEEAEASSVEEAARKDSAVHVSLSSDSLVKQPDPCGSVAPPVKPGDAKTRSSDAARERSG